MKKASLTLLCALALAGCGYRAPLHQSYIPVVTDSTLYSGVRADYQQLAALMEKDTGMKPIEGNTVSLVFEGQENLDRMLDDVRAAERSVYIEPYRFCLDSVGTVLAGILREKAASGVDVRIILDKSANTAEDIRKLKTLRDDGAMVKTFHRPVFFLDHWIPKLATHRNHRKLLLLDGSTAYVGSRNIQDKYFFDWHDADVRITGPVLADLTEAFHGNQRNIGLHRQKPLYVAPDLEEKALRDTVPGLEQFFGVPVQVVPEYPTDRRLPTRNCLEWALAHAKKYFWYYNPDLFKDVEYCQVIGRYELFDPSSDDNYGHYTNQRCTVYHDTIYLKKRTMFPTPMKSFSLPQRFRLKAASILSLSSHRINLTRMTGAGLLPGRRKGNGTRIIRISSMNFTTGLYI